MSSTAAGKWKILKIAVYGAAIGAAYGLWSTYYVSGGTDDLFRYAGGITSGVILGTLLAVALAGITSGIRRLFGRVSRKAM